MTADAAPKLELATLSDRVYETIWDQIISGQLQPGTQIRELPLAETLGVSKAPVREALTRLTNDQLVELRPRRGFFVTTLSSKDLEEMVDLRIALECLAIRRATSLLTDEDLYRMNKIMQEVEVFVKKKDIAGYTRLDAEFHDAIVQASDNKRLRRLVNTFGRQTRMLRMLDAKRSYPLEETYVEHQRILDALIKRDVARSESLMREHLENHKRRLVGSIRD